MNTVKALSEALPYINKYKGKTFIIKIGGALVNDNKTIEQVCQDICLLTSTGIKVVVVHGGGPQADALAGMLGYSVEKVDGKRITSREVLEIAKMVYGGKINIEIISALRKHGGRGVGISGVDGNLITARKEGIKNGSHAGKNRIKEIDFGLVGEIVSVDTGLLHQLLENGYTPVLCSLVADDNGEIYNVNADTLAEQAAIAMNAEKFINMTSTKGILENPKDHTSTIDYLSVGAAKKLVEEKKTVTKGMLPKLCSCISAVEGGVKSANIINGTQEHSLLLEIFTDRGGSTYVGKKPPF